MPAAGKMTNGNLELHRGLAGMCLFTDIDVGLGDHALQSGGPEASGPSCSAFTIFWNVKASAPMPPPGSNSVKQGECAFGPDLVFVGTRLQGRICKDWHYEAPDGAPPANLYDAQLARRRSTKKGGKTGPPPPRVG